MIPYGRQDISPEDIATTTEALMGDLITTGTYVEEFERELTRFVKADTFVVNSGTAALHAAYFGAGIGAGDEIITPPNTFIATQATAIALGASIVYADIDVETGLISLESTERLIGPRTKAIVVVDYAGQTCDLDEFRKLADRHRLILIEDAAHSLGTLYKSRSVGSIADVTTFSFYPTKNITTGEGGAVSSNNPELLARAKKFSRQGLVRNEPEFVLLSDGPWHQEVHEYGLNYRLTDFQSALGISQLKRIHEFKMKRRLIFDCYVERLKNLDFIRPITQVAYCDTMWHLFPVRVRKEIRKDLFIFLRSEGVGVQVNYFPAYLHPASKKSSTRPWTCPNSELFYREEISLPMHTRLNEELVHHICDLMERFIRKK
jgi:dTDP-4-amino-4,6-dideoxygalactose transaminase